MKIAAILVSRNRPDLVEDTVQFVRGNSKDVELCVVESGTDQDKLTEHTTIWYDDPDYRGKVLAHNIGMHYMLMNREYDYFWFFMNDTPFQTTSFDVGKKLASILQKNPHIGALSPTSISDGYASSHPQGSKKPRVVTTTDYLNLMVPAQVVKDVGFLNPDFNYSWGAIHEYSYKLYQLGLAVAYTDQVTYKHLGGSTYTNKTNTIKREDYKQRAKEFAAQYFVKEYGNDWDKKFWETANREYDIEVNTYELHRAFWEKAL